MSSRLPCRRIPIDNQLLETPRKMRQAWRDGIVLIPAPAQQDHGSRGRKLVWDETPIFNFAL
jgi:hypothetical protein